MNNIDDFKTAPTFEIDGKYFRPNVVIRCMCGFELLKAMNEEKPQHDIKLVIGASRLVLRCPKCKKDRKISFE